MAAERCNRYHYNFVLQLFILSSAIKITLMAKGKSYQLNINNEMKLSGMPKNKYYVSPNLITTQTDSKYDERSLGNRNNSLIHLKDTFLNDYASRDLRKLQEKPPQASNSLEGDNLRFGENRSKLNEVLDLPVVHHREDSQTSVKMSSSRRTLSNEESMTHRIGRFSASPSTGDKLTVRLGRAYSLDSATGRRSESVQPQRRLVSHLSFQESNDDNGHNRYESGKVRRRVLPQWRKRVAYTNWMDSASDVTSLGPSQAIITLVSRLLENNGNPGNYLRRAVTVVRGRDLSVGKPFGDDFRFISVGDDVFVVAQIEGSKFWLKIRPELRNYLSKLSDLQSIRYPVDDIDEASNLILKKLNSIETNTFLPFNPSQEVHQTKGNLAPDLEKGTGERILKVKRSKESIKDFQKGYVVANLSFENSDLNQKNSSWYYNMTCDSDECVWDNKTTNLTVLATQGWSVSKCNSAKCVLMPSDQKKLISKYIKDLLILLSVCVVMVVVFIVTFYYCIQQKVKKCDRSKSESFIGNHLFKVYEEVTMETATSQDYRKLIQVISKETLPPDGTFLAKLYLMNKRLNKTWSPPIAKES